MKIHSVAVAALLLAGCYGDNLQPAGPHYQYVVSELRIPENNLTARESGLDLDRDKVVDNQLGMVFGALNSLGLGVGETAREALLRGGLVMLADLQTPDFGDADLATFSTYLGGDPDPAPCLDLARLETCGQHVLGTGQFSVDPASASDQADGPIVDGVYHDLVGLLPVEIAIDPAAPPIRLDLRGARVQLTQMSETHISGLIGGGITQTDIDSVVIPQATAQMNRIVQSECSQPAGTAPCGCIPNARADTLQEVFDTNHDCTITVLETSGNSLVRALLSTDIEVGGEELLSFGVAIELAPATFTTP